MCPGELERVRADSETGTCGGSIIGQCNVELEPISIVKSTVRSYALQDMLFKVFGDKQYMTIIQFNPISLQNARHDLLQDENSPSI